MKRGISAASAPLANKRSTKLDRHCSIYYEAWKRVFDITVGLVALFLLAPILLVVALLIKMDSKGPVFFRQWRVGYKGEQFRIWKFRTMTVMEDGESVLQAEVHDPRVTWVGHYLRRTNIDELPQLLNVLKGDMSLVGPRPHAIAHDIKFASYDSRYSFRHKVKPGITGWAQVNGFRGPIPDASALFKRVDYDLFYVENRTLSFDLYILLSTVLPKAFRNAH